MMKLNKIILILIIFFILKELLFNNIHTENFTERTLTEYDLGKKNYHDARNYCMDKNMILASKEEILAKDIKFNGQDVWTPVRGYVNKWMQIGNRYHRHGKIHNPPPSWGTSNSSYPFKKKFYCTKREDFQEFNLGTNNYNDARKYCNDMEMNLASKEEILAKDIKFNGQDVWTPVRGSDNKWMQIGNRYHKHGKIHNPPPSWGTSNSSYPFKKKFYCTKREVKEYPLGTNNYNDARKHCSNMGMKLASKEEILREDIKFNGQDVWTPVRDSDNKWMQIGNRYHKHGKIHNPPPSWGTSNSSYPFKKTFYCSKRNIIEYPLERNNYNDAKKHCNNMERELASKEEILLDDIKFKGQDVWTPIKGSDNKWMQIGNRFHKYGKIHNPPPSWGTSNSTYPFKKTFYCGGKSNFFNISNGNNYQNTQNCNTNQDNPELVTMNQNTINLLL